MLARLKQLHLWLIISLKTIEIKYLIHNKGDADKLVETKSSKYLDEDLTELNRNMLQTDYINSLTNTFIEY